MAEASVCQSCSAVSTVRPARFCARCGGLLVPTEPTIDDPPADRLTGVEAAGANTLEQRLSAGGMYRRRRGAPSRWLAAGLIVVSGFAGVLLGNDRRAAEVPPEAAGDAVDGQHVQPVEGGRPPKQGDVVGLWLEVGDDDRLGVLLSFAGDGTFRWDDDGMIASDAAVRGTWELNGGVIRVTSEGSVKCDDGASWSWEVEYSRAGRLDMEQTGAVGEGGCGMEPRSRVQLYRLAPEPALLAERDLSEPAESRPATAADLRGVWVRVDADNRLGSLVSFDPEGAYAIDDGGNLDGDGVGGGSWDLGDDVLTFTSAGAPACRAGEVWAWQVGAARPGQLDVVIAEPGDHDDCPTAEAGTQETHLQLSPLTSASAHRLVPDASSHELDVAWSGDGCEHNVPATLPAGTHTLTTENGHADRVLGLMVQPFWPGHGFEDLVEAIGPDLPVINMHAAEALLLEEAGHRIRAAAGSRTIEDVTLTAGDYAMVCWLRGPPATEWWPVGSLTVTNHTHASSHTDHETEDAAALATAEAYLTARDAYDAVTARELLADDVIVSDASHLDVDELGLAFTFLELIDQRVTPLRCEVASSTEAGESDPDGVEVVCAYSLDGRLQRIVGHGPIAATFRLTVVDGLITRSSDGFPRDEFDLNVWDPFAGYMHARQVHSFVMRDHDGTTYPELTPDALKLLAVTLEDYEDEYEAWTANQRTDVGD